MSIALPGLLMTAPIPDADRSAPEPPDRDGRTLPPGRRRSDGAVNGVPVTTAGDVDLAAADTLRGWLPAAFQAHRHAC